MEVPSCSDIFSLNALHNNLPDNGGDEASFQSVDLDSPSSEEAVMCPLETISLDIWQLKTWAQQDDEQLASTNFNDFLESSPNHETAPLPIDEDINNKICLWSGDITCLKVGALVHRVTETFTDTTEALHLYSRAGPGMRRTLTHQLKACPSGDVVATSGFCLPARYVLHAATPPYTGRRAGWAALGRCYRRVFSRCQELGVSSLALPVLQSGPYPHPAMSGAHLALKMLRTHLLTASPLRRLVLVLSTDNIAPFTRLLPLYFPRNAKHLEAARFILPVDVTTEEPDQSPDPLIHITDNPQHAVLRETGEQYGSGDFVLNVGEHSFARMEEEVDRQRLLGTGTEVEVVSTEVEKREAYARLLRQANTSDLQEISGIGLLYQCGTDRRGRPVIVFCAKWFKFAEINLDKALLYLVKLLEPIAARDYVIVYFHTLTTAANHPSMAWIRRVYDVLEYKHKKHLKAFYIVHPTLWTKIMTWWFTTFMAPQIKDKVHTITGVEYLYDIMDADQLEVPAYIMEYDMTVNGLRYYKGAS